MLGSLYGSRPHAHYGLLVHVRMGRLRDSPTIAGADEIMHRPAMPSISSIASNILDTTDLAVANLIRKFQTRAETSAAPG